MSLCHALVVVSLVNLLHYSHEFTDCDTNCMDKPVFTPSSLTVKYGDPTSATCSVCRQACKDGIGLEKAIGDTTENGTTISWTVDKVTEWEIPLTCFYNDDPPDHQCCSILLVTAYKPPDDVSLRFVNHSGPMFEGRQYTLECTVQNVAPVQNLIVTFYKGRTALREQSNSSQGEKRPVTKIFTLNISPSEEDDGVQYSCEAKLDLEMPQPPLVASQNITSTVYYKPRLKASPHPEPIVIKKGNALQLDCSAVGNPSPSYIWTHPSNGRSHCNSSTFTIDSTASSDSGEYSCYVNNIEGNATVKFNVDVQGDIIIFIITGVAALLLILAGVTMYYYKKNRMGSYNVLEASRSHKMRSVLPTTESPA